MNEKYYNDLLKLFIGELIDRKEEIVEDITGISTYIDFEKESQDLGNIDLNAINLQRNNMGAIYQLIEDLEKLKKKEV